MRGHGPLTIATPVGSPNAANAARVAREAEKIAKEAGLVDEDIVSQGYNVSAGEASAPVILSFTRFIASASPCGDWSKNAGRSVLNRSMPDFGCATQNNLAAMVEDPHDLIEPRPMGASDAERRAVVFDKYRKGEPTATPRTEEEKANVSEVAQ
jgi:pilus assembly protein CpaD